MRKHGIRVFFIILAFAVLGSLAYAGAPQDDSTVAVRGESSASQRLTGFGGILESRLESLLRWVRDVFGDDQPISGNGLTDDPDPTSSFLGADPETSFEEDPAKEHEEQLQSEDGEDLIMPAYQRS